MRGTLPLQKLAVHGTSENEDPIARKAPCLSTLQRVRRCTTSHEEITGMARCMPVACGAFLYGRLRVAYISSGSLGTFCLHVILILLVAPHQ
jgi:hypothetical protein